jgi:hypothetical protein
MHCGCPLPGETIGLKLARLVSNPGQKASLLIPTNNPDLLAGTHPSDHNAVFAFHHKKMSESARKARQKKIEKRRERDAELARRGKMDPESIERSRGHRGHDAAFLMPIPLFFYGSGVGGCAAYGGIVSSGSCAAVGVFERKCSLLIDYWIRVLAVVQQVELLAAQGVVVRVELLEGVVVVVAVGAEEDAEEVGAVVDVGVEVDVGAEVEVAEAEVVVESRKPMADKMI